MANEYKHKVSFPIYNVIISDENGQKRGTMRVQQVPGENLFIIGIFDNKKQPYEELKLKHNSPDAVKQLISENMNQGLVHYNTNVWRQYAR